MRLCRKEFSRPSTKSKTGLEKPEEKEKTPSLQVKAFFKMDFKGTAIPCAGKVMHKLSPKATLDLSSGVFNRRYFRLLPPSFPIKRMAEYARAEESELDVSKMVNKDE